MKNLIVLLMMLGAVQGFAADGGSVPVPSQTKPRPKMVKVGTDYYLDMQDGRVAGFFQMIGKVARASVGLRQIENTCDFAQELSDCQVEFDLATRGFSLRWVKHADATKLNTVVNMVSQTNGKTEREPLEDNQNALFWYATLSDNTYSSFVKPDRLICNSLAWAKNIPVTNARINIDSWSTELMFQSTETGANENQTTSTAFDVVLKVINPQTLELERIGQAKDFITAFPPYFSSQVASLTFMDKNKQICQVAFESSLDNLARLERDQEFKKLDPTTLRPLRKATSLTNSLFYFNLNNALAPSSTVEFE